MASIGDVQNALAGLIASALYPNGTAQPNSIAGFPVRIGAGWPTATALDPDLRTGTANVSIYGIPQERKTTRYLQGWQVSTVNPPTITLSSSGATVTVGGALPPKFFSQNLAVFVANVPYTYSVQPSDTLATIAAALASQIAQAWPGTTSQGQTITLPAGAALGALITGGTGSGVKVLKNQCRTFKITIWASTPAQREALANLIDPMLADTNFLVMPDGLNARLIYENSVQQDLGEKARLFRLDLRYTVDFATTKVMNAPQVIVTQIELADQTGNTIEIPLTH